MDNELKYGGPDQIPQVEATCSNDIFENGMRNVGVDFVRDYFELGKWEAQHLRDGLCKKSGILEFVQDYDTPF